MDPRRKIFLRLVLLIFLLIAVIGTAMWILKQDTPPHDTVFSVIAIAALGGGAFLLGILLARAITCMSSREVDQLAKSLRENEARLKGIFDNMSSGVAVYRTIDNGNNFIFLDFNHAAERINKIARDDLIGRSVTEVFPRIKKSGLLDAFRRVWRTGKPEHFSVSFYRGDHIEGWWENYIYRLPSGEMVAIYDDVKERKQAAQMIEEGRTRYQAAIDASGQILYDWDASTGEAVYGGSLETILGYTQEEMEGGLEHWKDLIHPNDRPGFDAVMKQRLKAGGSMHVVYRVRKKDGEYADIEDTGKFFVDSQGNLVRRLGFLKDITARKQAVEEIKRREQYLSGLNEAAQTLLIPRALVPFQDFIDKIGPAANASRAYIFINHRGPAGELIAIRKAEWHADGFKPGIDNPFPRELSYREVLPLWGEMLSCGSGINSLAANFPEREKEIFESYEIRAVLIIPITIENKFIGFIGFDNCVSNREWDKVEETFLRAATNDLAQAISRVRSDEKVLASLREKEVLLREIHHRVKNNMQVIVSLLRMHSRRADDKRVEQVFNDCRDRVYAMSLIHEALYQSDDLARIDFETYLSKLCVNLNQVYGASSKGIMLKVNPCSVVLDIDQSITVGMVISELITNSIKHAFSEGRGGTVSISLTGLDKDNVELIVEDDGKGLPLDIDILDPPSLGLQVVVSAITHEWGGSIEVRRDGGTRYVIRFKCNSTK